MLVSAAVLAAFLAFAPASRRADAQTPEPLPSFAPALTPAPTPSPTVTPLPPPIWPPQDAAGNAHTTPPLPPVRLMVAPSPPGVLWLNPTDVMTVQAETHAGRLFVPVVVNGRRSLFLLDTASPTTLDADAAADPQSSDTTLDSLQIGDLHFSGMTVKVARIRPFAQTYLGWPADGIIGQDFFARYPVMIDYGASLVTVFRTPAAANAAQPSGAFVLRMASVRGFPAVDGSIDGVAGSFILDTGLGGFVTLGLDFARDRHFLRSGDGLSDLWLAQPDGELPGRTVRLKTFALGSASFDRPVVGIMTQQPDPKGLPDTPGVIGSELLQRFTVMLDAPAGSAAFAPRSGLAGVPFDRSGLWLIVRGDSIAVRSVVPRSPGDVAGLHGGDVIAQLNGKPVGVGDLDVARALFAQDGNASVDVAFVRGPIHRRTRVFLRNML